MLHLAATTWYSIETLFLTALVVEIVNTAVGERGHPKLGLVPATIQLFRDTGLPRLLDEGKVDHRAHIVIIVDQLPLVRATTPSDLAEEALACLANAIRGPA